MSVRFTRLRLTGFKSFVDPTELLIEPGLTGVVGPNGCGKSNLLEALRWVMGEASARSLRGAGMEDVIFAGTAVRPARAFADVALLIDNRSRQAPAAFNGSDELEVSRRIERDLGSSYRINGKEVRQKDVQLLFADAASGAQSAALVSQGRIGSIVTAKPSDRRAILEEAAGIAGLHGRRKEAEQRLQAADANLTRLTDVTGQMEQQIATLGRQARQAERYRALSREIGTSEAMLAFRRWRDAADQLASTRGTLEVAQAKVQETARAAAGASARQAEMAAALPALRRREAEAAAQLQRLLRAADALDDERQRLAGRLADLERQRADLARDRQREDSLRADSAAAQARLAEEATTLEARLQQTQRQHDATVAAVAAAETAVRAAEQGFDALTARNADAQARKRAAEQRQASAEQRLTALARDIARARTDLAALAAAPHADLQALERALAQALAEAATAADRQIEAEDTRTAAETAREDLRRTLAEAETALRQSLGMDREVLARALEQVRADAAALTRDAAADLTALEAEHGALSRLLAHAQTGAQPAIDRIVVTPGYELALAAALGDDLEADVGGEGPRRWPADAPPLQSLPPLPAGCAPLSSVVQAPAGLAARLAMTGLLPEGMAAPTLLPGQRLVDTAGRLWRWDGFTADSPAKADAGERLRQRNRLAELETAIVAARQRCAAVTATCADRIATAQQKLDRHEAGATRTLAQVLQDARGRQEAANGAVEAAQLAERIARQERRDGDAACDRLRRTLEAERIAAQQRLSRHDSLTATLAQLDADMDRAEAERAAASGDIAGLADVEQLAQQLADQRRLVERRRQELSAARATLDALARQIAVDEARREAISREAASWMQRAEDTARQVAELQGRDATLAAEHAALAARPAEITQQRESLAGQIAVAEQGRAAAATALADAEAALRSADAEARGATEAQAQAREDRARAEAAADAAQTRLSEINRGIGDAYRCPGPLLPDQAGFVAEAALATDLAALESRLERQKADRERLGGVNLRADIELAEQSTALDATRAEMAELETAIAKLRGSIGALNREGRQRLLEAFAAVNGHFTALFTRLFGGGTAHLSLIDSDDPLSAGLEIMASPPGKKLQALSLLSGGEQALTACALIFAVFLTNPTPVCVLDEVDAPLDDANVDRYCDLLHDIAERTGTRFLIVTHNAVTMSRMDRLYGVTMAERGVSQLVSVNLRRAEMLLAAE